MLMDLKLPVNMVSKSNFSVLSANIVIEKDNMNIAQIFGFHLSTFTLVWNLNSFSEQESKTS